jgi:hypothetical protein
MEASQAGVSCAGKYPDEDANEQSRLRLLIRIAKAAVFWQSKGR